MQGILAFALGWGPLIGLVFLGWMLPQVVSQLFWSAHHRLDAEHPDDLPLTAGQWLEREIERRRLDLRMLVWPSKKDGVDAFFPRSGFITLSQKTYAKRDPAYWAIAAHELGHALLRLRSRALANLLTASRWGGEALRNAAHMLILTNILFASRELHAIAFAVAAVGAGLYVVVLAEEAVASATAVRILARDPGIGPRAMRSVRSLLLWAFVTYLGGLAGELVLLAQRDFVLRKIEALRVFEPGGAPGPSSLVLAGILSALLLLLSLVSLRRAIFQAPATNEAEAKSRSGMSLVLEVARGTAAVALVAVVWDQPHGLDFILACGLLITASSAGLMIPLLPVVIVLGIPLLIIQGVFALLVAGAFRVLMGPPRANLEGEVARPDGAQIERSNAAIDQANLDAKLRPDWHERVGPIVRPAVQLGFVVYYWVAYATH